MSRHPVTATGAYPEIVRRPLGGLGYPFHRDPFLAFVRRASAFWAAFLEIRWLRRAETGDSVRKGEAIEKQALAVSASVLLHVPSLTSKAFVAPGAYVGCRPRLITQPTRPPDVPHALRPAGRAVRASPRGSG